MQLCWVLNHTNMHNTLFRMNTANLVIYTYLQGHLCELDIIHSFNDFKFLLDCGTSKDYVLFMVLRMINVC